MQKILIGTGLAIGIGLCGGLAMALVGSPTTNTKWVLAGTTAVGERYFVEFTFDGRSLSVRLDQGLSQRFPRISVHDGPCVF